MAENRLKSLPSFTILEVTIVVAVLSILVTIITITLNRFNEQLKVNRDIQQELNNWMLVRSNFWTEYYLSDSIGMNGQMLVLYQPHRSVVYKQEEDQLMRKEYKKADLRNAPDAGEWKDMNVEITSIKEETAGEEQAIVLSFPVKGEEMQLRFLKLKNKADQVNDYFDTLNE